MLKINELNWTFCQFSQDDCFVTIHQGGELAATGEVQDIYFVNVLKTIGTEQYQEIYQQSFLELPLAINHINQKFSHWKFVNQLEADKNNEGGCGSCVAH